MRMKKAIKDSVCGHSFDHDAIMNYVAHCVKKRRVARSVESVCLCVRVVRRSAVCVCTLLLTNRSGRCATFALRNVDPCAVGFVASKFSNFYYPNDSLSVLKLKFLTNI